MNKNLSSVLLAGILLIGFTSCGQQKKRLNNEKLNKVYIGTYTKKEGHVDGKAEGIYLMDQDPGTGALKMRETVAEVVNPSFVKISEDNKNLYAVSELGPGDADSGFIYAFNIAEDNSLKELGKYPTGAFAPCHIEMDRKGNFVFVSNYVGGVVMVYKRNTDGSLTEVQKIALEGEQPHAHSVSLSEDNQYAYVADLGGDKIWIYHLDTALGKLKPNKQPYVALPEGAGPRHFTFGKDGRFAYSINELNNSVSVFEVYEDGGLKITQNISSLPGDFSDKSYAADIHLHPSGNFLYVSNRGHNSIASFLVENNTGKLSSLGHTSTRGKAPRNFAISPDGKYLYAANQDSGNIAIYKIDLNNGKLKAISDPVEVKTPVCIEFL